MRTYAGKRRGGGQSVLLPALMTLPIQMLTLTRALRPAMARILTGTMALVLAVTPADSALAQDTESESPAVHSVARPEQLQTLESYFRIAVENNPELSSLRLGVESRRQRILRERTLTDPEIGAGFYINPDSETNFTGRFSVRVMQMFPWFGTLDTRGRIEESASDAMARSLSARQLEIFTEIQNSWFDYYRVDHHIRVYTEIVAIVRDLESLIETRYETGRAGQADLLRIQMEKQRLLYRIEELEDEKNPVREELNALLNRAPDMEIDVPSELPERMLARTREELLRLVRARHPDFGRIEAQRGLYRRQMDLARLESRPSFGIGLEYMGRDYAMMSMMELDPVLVGMATVRIPLYRSRYRAQRREARLQLQAAGDLETDLTNRLRRDLERSMKSLRDAQRDFRLVTEELLPRSKQAMEILSQEYAVGQVGFDEVLQVVRELLMLEMERVNALVAQNNAMAAIEQLIASEIAE